MTVSNDDDCNEDDIAAVDMLPVTRNNSINNKNNSKISSSNSSNTATKVRFDGLDVQAMVTYLQEQCCGGAGGGGRRIVNIYDGGGSGETYIFKLEKKVHNNNNHEENENNDDENKSSSNNTDFLLMESGIRFHTISSMNSNDKGTMPSPFCFKLRKHLRGLRLERVAQIGKDRVVLFQFGSGIQQRHHILLELYAKGNLILTDANYIVLALLRSHIYNNNNNSSTTTNSNNTTNNPTTSTDGVSVRVGQVYPVSYATSIGTAATTTPITTTTSEGQQLLHQEQEQPPVVTTTKLALHMESATEFNAWMAKHIEKATATTATTTGTKKKKKSNNNSSNDLSLKTLLAQNNDSGVMEYGPSLIEHCILTANLNPHSSLVAVQQPSQSQQPQQNSLLLLLLTDEEWNRLRTALMTEGPRILECLRHPSPSHHNNKKDSNDSSSVAAAAAGGYILYRTRNDTAMTTTSTAESSETAAVPRQYADKILQEFLPVLLRQHDGRDYMTYTTFAEAVETFFDHMSYQRAIQKTTSAVNAAKHRLDKIRIDQQDRTAALLSQQQLLHHQASTVQLHADNVDKALAVINSALDSGMDWDQLDQIVAIEQKQNRNPIALLIYKLDLDNNAMILRLPTTTALATTQDLDDNDNNDATTPGAATTTTIDVTVQLQDSAYGNANRLFAMYRASKEKTTRTLEASTKAMKAAEDAAQRQLIEAQKKMSGSGSGGAVVKRHAPAWYEKFHWFITSDNYLVLGGRDAHQNELLVKRYLRKGDAYLHADVHGAATCILRAKRRRRRGQQAGTTTTTSGGGTTEIVPLSEQALREAGKFTICHSSAWTSRMVTSAWWVESHQVSKTAPTGEYLTVGSFMVRGKKTYLPPTPLEMGLAVLFRLGDDDSILRHKNERRDFTLVENPDEEDLLDDTQIAEVGGKGIVNAAENSPVHGEAQHSSFGELEEDKKNYVTEDDEEPAITMDCGEPSENNYSVGESNTTPADNDEDDPDNDDENDDATDEAAAATPAGEVLRETTPEKRGLSVRDRKLIKKYGSLEAAKHALGNGAGTKQEKKKDAELPKSATTTAPSSEQPIIIKRGQKSKLKRIGRKYVDQDEEDRALAMLALQGGEKIKGKKSGKPSGKGKLNVTENQQKAAVETIALLVKDTAAVAATLPKDVQELLASCVSVVGQQKQGIDDNGNDATVVVRWDKFDAETLEQLVELTPHEAQIAAAKRLHDLKQSTRIDNFSASLGGIIRTIRKHGYHGMSEAPNNIETTSSKRKTKAEKDQDATKWKEAMEAEGLVDNELDDDAVDDTVELAKLTGKPHADDVLLYAVPVCAPYQTLSQYTYRVKLTPGNLKRGKASKQCLELFLKANNNGSAAVERQLELIKRVSDNDWVQTICADVKIATAGAAKTAKNLKASSKKAKK